MNDIRWPILTGKLSKLGGKLKNLATVNANQTRAEHDHQKPNTHFSKEQARPNHLKTNKTRKPVKPSHHRHHPNPYPQSVVGG